MVLLFVGGVVVAMFQECSVLDLVAKVEPVSHMPFMAWIRAACRCSRGRCCLTVDVGTGSPHQLVLL